MALILFWRVKVSWKRGFAGELQNAFSIFAALGAGYMLLGLALDYSNGRLDRLPAGLIYLAFLLLVYKVINLLFKALKLFVSLPVIKGVDKVLGGLLGLVEAFLIIVVVIRILKSFLG